MISLAFKLINTYLNFFKDCVVTFEDSSCKTTCRYFKSKKIDK